VSGEPEAPWRASLRVRVVGLAAAVLLVAAIWLGSRGFREFDSALIGYAVAVVALTFAIVASYARWLRMPSTRRYWRRGWALLASPRTAISVPALLPRAIGGQLLGQGFIRRRGIVRWLAHQCLFWGVLGATAITFPLVFGWFSFRLVPGTASTYRMFVFGFGTVSFPTDNFLGWSMFHLLDYTAVLVIVGASVFLWRRFRDRAVMSTQRFGFDLVPLMMLVVISVTGLLLTVSASLVQGSYYDVIAVVHLAAVVLTLVFIPFGKFFHVVQRPASVGIQLYTEVTGRSGREPCARCGEPLAPAVFLGDLQATLDDLGQDYRLDRPGDDVEAGSRHLLDLCPRCRRVSRAHAYFDAHGRSFAR
jgi:hypothetical protein